MRRWWYVLLLSFPLPIAAQPSLAVAESLYTAGDHAAALSQYEVLAAAYRSPGLFMNIGNCHFKLGNKGEAVLWYERAHRAAPGDADIQANLDLARAQVVDRINAAPGIAIGGGWSAFRAGTDEDMWARRSLWACALTFVLFGIWKLLRTRVLRSVVLVIGIVGSVVTVTSLGFAAYRAQEVSSKKEAIIMAPKVDVRSEPNDAAAIVFVLHEGTKVRVRQQNQDRCEVELANGNLGWMKTADLERI